MSLRKFFIWFFVVFFSVITLAFVFGFYYFEDKYKESFYTGVSIGDFSAGGQKLEEVLNYFSAKENILAEKGIDVEILTAQGAEEIRVPMYSTGLTSDRVFEYYSLGDIDGTIKEAYNFGRTGRFWQKMAEKLFAVRDGKRFPLPVIVRKDQIDSFFKDELEKILIKPASARYSFNNGALIIIPEKIGETISGDSLGEAFEKKLKVLDIAKISLTVKDLPPQTMKKDLERFLPFAEKISQSPGVILIYNGYKWKIEGIKITEWLEKNNAGGMGINRGKLEEFFFKNVAFYIDSPMQNGRFEMRDGELVEIVKGVSGNVADTEKTARMIEEYILKIASGGDFTEAQEIALQIKVQEPSISQETIERYRISELVGSAETNFEGGSLDRQRNIEVGVMKLNGLLLAPGEEFSALRSIGEVSEEAGFLPELVIKAGKTQKEVGGGLCQISTTLFRLALNAGLPITERVNHRYVISYYGAGLDATIYDPSPDLRFINDTENYLLLQGKVKNNKVTLEFYGEKDGRTASVSEPELSNIKSPPAPKNILTNQLAPGQVKCTEIPHNGVTADATYTVVYPDGEVKVTEFHSVYQPWQKVCLVGSPL